jgi:hypothetical protein
MRWSCSYRASVPEAEATWARTVAPYVRQDAAVLDVGAGTGRFADLFRARFRERFDVDGVPIEVLELHGAPGDVVITHLHVFHVGSPNTSSTPRQMLANTVIADERGALSCGD